MCTEQKLMFIVQSGVQCLKIMIYNFEIVMYTFKICNRIKWQSISPFYYKYKFNDFWSREFFELQEPLII